MCRIKTLILFLQLKSLNKKAMMYIDKGVNQRDMKQAVLAKRLGVSRSAINAWENGISFPSLANLFELCHVFGTTPDYLLGFSSEHCVDISALTPSQQEMVVRLIHCFEEQNDMQKGKAAASV